MRLADYLRQNKLSASEFAQKIGVGRSTVSRWIDPDNPTRPRWSQIRKIETTTGGAVMANDFSPPIEDKPIASAAAA